MNEIVKNDFISLKDFVAQRKDLISTLGIFAALTLFAQEFMPGIFGSIVSFLFLTSFILLWLELWESFPSKQGTTRLALFENTIVYTGMAIILYWLARLKGYSMEYFIFVITLTISSSVVVFFSKKIKHYDIFNKLFKAKKGEKKALRFIFAFFITIGTFILIFLMISQIILKFNNEIETFFNLILQK